MTCAPSEDLDQPGHPPSLVSLRCALNGQLKTQCFFMRTAKTLARLGGCTGRSESSVGACVILLVLSCCGSIFIAVNLFIRKYIDVIDDFATTDATSDHSCLKFTAHMIKFVSKC